MALELPDPARGELARWRAPILHAQPGLRELATEDLHVTLCFLGAQDAADAAAILAACAVVTDRPAAALRLGRPLWLPPRAPRVLAVELADDGGLLAGVQAALSTALAAGGWYRPERRPFLAHTTVARVRRGAAVPAIPLPPPAPYALRADRVVLYRSQLGPRGARYEPLGAVTLGG